MKLRVVIFVLLMSFSLSTGTAAEDSSAKNTLKVLEGDEAHEISPHLKIWDFLEVAFSNTLWAETVEDQSYVVKEYEGYERGLARLEGDDWLNSLIRDTGRAAPIGVINKWPDKEIPVSVGWPSKVKDFFNFTPEVEASEDFIRIVETLTKNIAKKSGLNLRFVSDKSDKNYKGIHIVPISKTALHNKYKSYVTDVSYMRHPRVFVKEALLLNGVEFTPYSRSQVDGFFVPNDKNEIQFAACRIVAGLDIETQTALVTECILRSLGLPSAISELRGLVREHRLYNDKFEMTRKSFFLGHWNGAQNRFSKTLYHDSESALDSTVLLSPENEGAEPERDKNRYPARIQNSISKKTATEYDFQILKILYCPDIHTGDHKKEVLIRLLHEKKCH